MFFDNFLALCENKGVSPSRAVMEMGMNRSIATFWKNGTVPKMDTLTKIADYFGVSVGFLVDGEDGEKNAPAILTDSGAMQLEGTYLRLAQGAQELGLDDEDVDAILAIYAKHKQKNQ